MPLRPKYACYDYHPSRPERVLGDRYTINSRLLFYIYLWRVALEIRSPLLQVGCRQRFWKDLRQWPISQNQQDFKVRTSRVAVLDRTQASLGGCSMYRSSEWPKAKWAGNQDAEYIFTSCKRGRLARGRNIQFASCFLPRARLVRPLKRISILQGCAFGCP